MNTRKLKPIHELNRLSETERAQLWADLENGLSYSRAIRVLGTEHFVTVRRHRLFTWWHRENDRRAMNARLPAENQLGTPQFLDLLNAQSLPWSDLMHGRILQAGFLLANREDNTPAQLLTLQRLANNPFHQHLASEKLELSKRGFALREKQVAARSAAQKSSSFGTRHSDLTNSRREDHLGPLAKNMDGVEARAKAKFGSLNETNGLQSESPGISESLPLAPAIHPGDASPNPSDQASSLSETSSQALSSFSSSTSPSQPTSSSFASRPSVEEASVPHTVASSAVKKESSPPPQFSQLPPVKS